MRVYRSRSEQLESSRQARWQERQRMQGRCVTCGELAVNASHCDWHALVARLRHALEPEGKWASEA